MDSSAYAYAVQNSSHRGVAMVLSLVSAIVLSPLYVEKKNEALLHTRWNSSFIVPMVLAGLIIAIKTTSSSPSCNKEAREDNVFSSSDPSEELRFGSSSCALMALLIMLMIVLSWQNYVQHFFWR